MVLRGEIKMKNIFLVFLFTILFSLSTVAYSHCGIPANHAKATEDNAVEDNDLEDDSSDEEEKEKDIS